MAHAIDPTGKARKARTITAADPVTGATFTRRTARAYVAAVVTGADGAANIQQWCGRDDLAAKALAIWQRGCATARLAPVISDPWAEPEPVPAAEPVADPEPAARAPYAELIGEAAVRFARFARCYRLTPAQAREIRAEVWRWAAGYGLESEGAPYVWIRGGMAAALVRRGVLIPRHGFGHLWEPEALAILREIAQAQAAAEAAPQAEPVPVAAETVPVDPWDPGTPGARARVALQGERVATLWPVAQAVRGAGLTLPGTWASDGPVMAGEWPEALALAMLPSDCLHAAAVALAALPSVTVAHERALDACRTALAEPSRPL